MSVKAVCVAMALIAAATVSAEVYRVSTAAELVEKLNALKGSGAVIELAPGDYELDADPMIDHASAGISYLYVDGVHLCGTGDSPYKTRLIGGGTYRVMQGTDDSVIENLTITNGFVAANETGTKKRGGGYWGGGTITNCVIAGNKANNVGGGIYNKAVLYDCIVEGNESVASGGGGAHSVTAYRTVFRNNKAANNGGGVYACDLYDCVVSNNTAVVYGGGGYNVTYATNTLIAGNSAEYGGGAANGSSQDPESYVLNDCVVSNNVAVSNGGGLYRQSARGGCVIAGNTADCGGGAYESPLADCTIAGNRAIALSAGNGGGTYNCPLSGCEITGNVSLSNGGGVYDNTAGNVISNCVISFNAVSNNASTAYGGGICIGGCTVTHCTINGNAAMEWTNEIGKTITGTGGGAATGKNLPVGTLKNCVIRDNYAYAYGGGARGLRLVDCTLSDNINFNTAGTSPNAYDCDLEGCDVSGTMVEAGSASRTVFRDIGGEVAVTAEENPYRQLTLSAKTVYHVPNCTNCLFRDNRLTASSSYMFSGINNAAGSCSLVNCTIVSNNSANMFYRFQNEMTMKVVNSVIYGNRNRPGTADQDMKDYNCDSGALRFSHCAYGVSSLSGETSDWFDAGDFCIGGENGLSGPGFAWGRVPEHPYSLGWTSPLLGLGKTDEWMTDACDLRGDEDGGRYRRLRDGRVDLGCYQWWSMAGMTISIR